MVLGAHLKPEVNENDMSYFPLLQCEGTSRVTKRRWVNYLVWRRWMAMGGVVVSVLILALKINTSYSNYKNQEDITSRCRAGSSSTSYNGRERATILSQLEEPLVDFDVFYHEGTLPIGLEGRVDDWHFNSTSSDGGRYSTTNIKGEMTKMGECSWFPYSVWQKTWPSHADGSGKDSFAQRVPITFLDTSENVGCNENGTQFNRPDVCICSIAAQVFRDYKFMSGPNGGFSDEHVARQRNLLILQPDTRYCSGDFGQTTDYGVWRDALNKAGVAQSRLKCAAEYRGRSNPDSVQRDGEKRMVEGMLYNLGCPSQKVEICMVSPSEYGCPGGGECPPTQERKCCSVSEYTFSGTEMRTWESFMLFHTVIISVNDVLSGLMMARTWRNLRKSSFWAFWGFFFPFGLKFILFTIPGVRASAVDFDDVARRIQDYVFQQIGWEGSDQVLEYTTLLTEDQARLSVMEGGVSTPSLQAIFTCGADYAPHCASNPGNPLGDDDAGLAQLVAEDTAGYFLQGPDVFMPGRDIRGIYSAMAFHVTNTSPGGWRDYQLGPRTWYAERASVSLAYSSTGAAAAGAELGDAAYDTGLASLPATWRSFLIARLKRLYADDVSDLLVQCDHPTDYSQCRLIGPASQDLLVDAPLLSANNVADIGRRFLNLTEQPQAGHLLRRGWLKHYVAAWQNNTANWNAIRTNANMTGKGMLGEGGDYTFDCRWASMGKFHEVGTAANGLCGLPAPYGPKIRQLCCASCSPDYRPLFNTWTKYVEELWSSANTHVGLIMDGTRAERVAHWAIPVTYNASTTYGGVYRALENRLSACDPDGLFRVLTYSSLGDYSFMENPAKIDQLTQGHPALGECADFTNEAKYQSCFEWLRYLPIDLDKILPPPGLLDEALSAANRTTENLYDNAKKLAETGYALKYTASSAVGLLPIILALLPALFKGAVKVMTVVPENFLVGYIFVIVPILQLPIYALALSVLVQMSASWWIFAGTLLFLVAQVVPIAEAPGKIGPHPTPQHFKEDGSVFIFGIKVPTPLIQGFFMASALTCFIVGLLSLAPDLGLDTIIGKTAQQYTVYLTALTALLNFFKGKAYTTVMSADAFIWVLLGEAKNRLLFPKEAAEYDDLVVDGILMYVPPTDVADVQAHFPAGFNAPSDIKEMISHRNAAMLARRQKSDLRVSQNLEKQLEKQQRKLSKKSSSVRSRVSATEEPSAPTETKSATRKAGDDASVDDPTQTGATAFL